MRANGRQPQRAPDGTPVHCDRRHPEQTTLHRLVQQHAATFFAQAEDTVGADLAQRDGGPCLAPPIKVRAAPRDRARAESNSAWELLVGDEGCAAQIASGVSGVGNSGRRLRRLPRRIRVEVSHGGRLPMQLAAWAVSHMPPAYKVACPCAFYSRRSCRSQDGGRALAGQPTRPITIHLRYNVSQLINKELVMAATSMVHVRVDEHIKAQATETLAAMGLSVSDAVRVFLTRVVAEQQLPFSLKAPNANTRAAMAEARTISKARFASAKTLIHDLEKGAKR